MSHIIVEQGNEFRIRNYNITENDVFASAYAQATEIVREIVDASIHDQNSGKPCTDFLNNIIAFTGERGQGKSSAMTSFANSLTHTYEDLSPCTLINFKTNCVFKQIGPIDPSAFDTTNNILDVIVARLFKEFQTLCSKPTNNLDSVVKDRMFRLFGRVYQSLCLNRNADMRRNIEQNYESNLQELVCLSDGTTLRDTMQHLLTCYLDICKQLDGSNKQDEYFLVISIDDLDINTEHAFRMAEQIRKYLMIPRVVIIMAIRIEQLKMCIEKHMWSTLRDLHGSDRFNSHEAASMAAKYVDKLIPDGRKIVLPGVHIMAENEENPVKLIYGPMKNGKIKNLLEKYGDINIQETLLRFIYDRTGIAFIPPRKGYRLHPIIPETLRELVSLLCVLGKMNELDRSSNQRARLNNLKMFEEFFIHTWVPNYLDYGHCKIIWELYRENTFHKHMFITNRIMDMIENNKDMYTVDPRSPLMPTEDAIEIWKERLSRKKVNPLSYNIGDVLSLLDVLAHRFVNEQMQKFIFAVKASYTLTMQKLVLNQDKRNIIMEANAIHKFLGDSLWGYRTASTLRDGRGAFYFSVSESGEVYDLLLMAVLCDFPNKERANGEVMYEQLLISGNNQIKRNAYFHVDNLLISCVDSKFIPFKLRKKTSDEYFNVWDTIKLDSKIAEYIVTNIEVLEYIQTACAQGKDIKSEVKTASEYMSNFLDILDISFSSIPYFTSFAMNRKLINNQSTRESICNSFQRFDENRGNLELKRNDALKEKYENKVNAVLENAYTGKLGDIRVITKICTALYLKNQALNLARSIAFKENNEKPSIRVSGSIKRRVQELYVKCSLIIVEKGNGESVNAELLDIYNECARELRGIIDSNRN